MIRWSVVRVCVFFAVEFLRAAPAVPAARLPELREQLAGTLASSDSPGALWGAQVVSFRSGRIWFETNAATRMVPASNTKLFTAALALDRLGPSKRLVTSLRISAPPDASGRLAGPLRIVGGGDPTLCPRLHGGAWGSVWAPLVEAVRTAGIRQVDGGLICDESRFAGPPYGSGWSWDDLAESYGAAVSALTAGDNAVSVVVTPGPSPGSPAGVRLDPVTELLALESSVLTSKKGLPEDLSIFRLPGDSRLRVSGTVPLGAGPATLGASVPTPALWFGTLFQDALRRAGVAVSGPIRVIHGGDRGDSTVWREVASVPSPPVGELVREMMKPSQNLYAQLLLLSVGAAASEARTEPDSGSGMTTEAAGLAELPALLRMAGIDARDVALEEGSGLSRKNLVTPRSLVQLLTSMMRHPAAAPWRAAMPIGGVDGTLRSRFGQPGLKGNVRAKTGTLRHVQSLSGYLTNSVGEPLVFSILVNGAVAPAAGSTARQAMDAWVGLLALSAVREE